MWMHTAFSIAVPLGHIWFKWGLYWEALRGKWQWIVPALCSAVKNSSPCPTDCHFCLEGCNETELCVVLMGPHIITGVGRYVQKLATVSVVTAEENAVWIWSHVVFRVLPIRNSGSGINWAYYNYIKVNSCCYSAFIALKNYVLYILILLVSRQVAGVIVSYHARLHRFELPLFSTSLGRCSAKQFARFQTSVFLDYWTVFGDNRSIRFESVQHLQLKQSR
jgi:hypothetical protein